MTLISKRIGELGLVLPLPSRPSASYVPWRKCAGQLWISGQVSDGDQGGILGVVGRDVDLPRAVEAARLCALRIVSHISAALDDDAARLIQIVRITGYVQVENGFCQIPQVIDGCSQLLIDAFGDRGLHSRSSVGVRHLPRNFAVECDAVVEFHAG